MLFEKLDSRIKSVIYGYITGWQRIIKIPLRSTFKTTKFQAYARNTAHNLNALQGFKTFNPLWMDNTYIHMKTHIKNWLKIGEKKRHIIIIMLNSIENRLNLQGVWPYSYPSIV